MYTDGQLSLRALWGFPLVALSKDQAPSLCPSASDPPRWASQRQGSVEGGFNGRTNKLVDGCYSFWQGGLFPLLQRLSPQLMMSSSGNRVRVGGGGQERRLHLG